jgi:hypothetical protein
VTGDGKIAISDQWQIKVTFYFSMFILSTDDPVGQYRRKQGEGWAIASTI